MSDTPDPVQAPPTPSLSHGPTGGADAEARDAELARREVEAEKRAAAGDPQALAEANGLDAQRVTEELDRQAQAAREALDGHAPKSS